MNINITINNFWMPKNVFTMELSTLANLIETTKFAMAKNNATQALNGIEFELEDNVLRTVATDGHRLAICSLNVNPTIPSTFSVIIPHNTVIELANVISYYAENDDYEDEDTTVSLEITINNLRISIGDTILTTQLNNSKFPNYRNVLPHNPKHVLETDAENFKSYLNSIAMYANKNSKYITLDLNDNLLKIIVNDTQEISNYELKAPLNISYQGTPMKVCFNANYLIDVLENWECQRIRMSFVDNHSACLIEDCDDDTRLYYIMPVALK